MQKKSATFKKDQNITEVVATLIKEGIPGGPVVNEQNELIGVITEDNCLKATIGNLYYDQPYGIVGDYMNSEVEVINGDATMFDLTEVFSKSPAHCYPVVDGKRRPIGVISRRDILIAVKRHQDKELKNGPASGHRG